MNLPGWLRQLFSGRPRAIGVVLFVLALAGLVKLSELALLKHYYDSWDTVSEDLSRKHLADATVAFHEVQRSTRRLVNEIAQRPEVNPLIRVNEGGTAELFDFLARSSNTHRVGLEVYDSRGTLVSWAGRSGGLLDDEVRDALGGQLSSFVVSGSVTSWLFVSSPIRRENQIVGAMVGWRAIDVKYPLNNRLVRREGLSLTLSERFGVPVEFIFSRAAELRKDGRYLSGDLTGINGSRVGVVSVMRPSRSAYLDLVRVRFDFAIAFLLGFALLMLSFLAIRRAWRLHGLLARGIAITVIVWSARYAFLLLEIPSSYLDLGIFDPSGFASKFGGGLAKSIGEMTITLTALIMNTILVLRATLKRAEHQSPWSYPKDPLVRSTILIVSATFLFLLLRGYGATIRSVVFDSTLRFADPNVIIPSFELGLMVLNLFALSFCLIVIAVGLTSFIVSLMTGDQTGNRPWLMIAGLYVLASILFGVLQSNPLMSTTYRLFFGAGVLVFTYHLHRLFRKARKLGTVNNLLIAFALSAAFFYPQLDMHVRAKEKSQLETLAGEVMRPVDGWLTTIVSEALEGFATDEALDVLTSARPEDVQNIAFTRWAQSTIGKEGYTCRFSFEDSSGRVLSMFSLGGQAVFGKEYHDPLPDELTVAVREEGAGVSTTRVYSGSIPVFGLDDRLIGWGLVSLAAGQKTLFRGDNPPIVRSVNTSSLESFHTAITVSQYEKDTLAFSTNENISVGVRLSPEVVKRLADGEQFVWGREGTDGATREALFVRRLNSDEIIGLGIEQRGIWGELFSLVKVIVYYSIVALVVIAGVMLYRLYRGRPYELKFRDRLLAALLVTTIIPIAALALYGRYTAEERHMESIRKQLAHETSVISAMLRPLLAYQAATSLADIRFEQIAERAAADFNFYQGMFLLGSSRPELFEAGILDRRLDGSVYAGVYDRRKQFSMRTESVGGYQYTVGYAPVLDDAGEILGVVSVPSLYRQEELQKEVSQQDALLFGVYAFLLMVGVVVATTIANRIAAPIHRLTEATKRVARGDLDQPIPETNVDGEIGDLVKSFGEMTQDLKKSRNELVQIERELAWKEMAKQVAHEIRNPLTPMKLSLQHLRQTYADKSSRFGEIFEEVSKTIIQQIDALDRIASEFSHFARMPRAKLEHCDVNALLRESAQLFDQEPGVEFVMFLEEDIPPVLADRQELRRAFINIIRNGIQAMGGKGRMELRSRHHSGSIVVDITDHGSGIAQEFRDKLFQPNFSTKTDGMGLGLAIVKKTVDDLGGSVDVESEIGKGTTMTITLPARKGASV